MTIKEKKQRIQTTHPNLSVQKQCDLLGLPRSSYYRGGRTEQETPENIEIMRVIDKEYTDHPFYGTPETRRIQDQPETGSATDAQNGDSVHCTETEYQQSSSST
jgi:hypothetical protein